MGGYSSCQKQYALLSRTAVHTHCLLSCSWRVRLNLQPGLWLVCVGLGGKDYWHSLASVCHQWNQRCAWCYMSHPALHSQILL